MYLMCFQYTYNIVDRIIKYKIDIAQEDPKRHDYKASLFRSRKETLLKDHFKCIQRYTGFCFVALISRWISVICHLFVNRFLNTCVMQYGFQT